MTSTSQSETLGTHPARWGRVLDDGRVQCLLCPRHCRMRDGQRGFCFVRANNGGRLVLDTWGRSSGFCLDPIEKKPLNHYLPGTSVLSFGTAGCNLGCRFCQNHEISTSREVDTLTDAALPEDIADAAVAGGAASVAFTYNDPVIFAEYAIDIAAACRDRGVRTIGVTAGYISPNAEDADGNAREEFFGAMDAVNVDLKGFTPEFYKRLTGADLDVVLDNLIWLAGTDTWVEITTLLIPGHNDSDDEIRAMAEWIVDNLGPDVPHHFSAFHPDNRMRDVPPTPPTTLRRAREIALDAGERHVYTGNVHDKDGDTTFCPGCDAPVIVRDWYRMVDYQLVADASGRGSCPQCGTTIPGLYDAAGPGDFGARRIPIRIGRR
ncbi:AmmeMemoRadiSam system radical SAM enzyme [Corynebacterium hansenii]|uniref:AmmeMemoRadiSam system radical SAM enzyme n=1 Tax=Corynebacterium hansenii TaxID=394964 RepID=A0ABV7ZUC5_9CORY|nr:AmmeMemoRadiSam system radical SAM enzyme [Corynebacterium hansenii]WJZ00110.1 Pyruvate formate-lyase 1-activating enzyme [Corynebacterium hansenii]